MPKKAPKGPFFFFMLEWKKQEEARGKRWTIPEATQACGPEWQNLSERQREPYKAQAKLHKNEVRINGEKYTTQGIPLSFINKANTERIQKEQNMKLSISEMLQTAYCNNSLECVTVYIIAFNYFCKTSQDVFIPAEMALVKFNLKDGVIAQTHIFIDPGKLPLGMAYEAQAHSDATHRLPIPPNAKGEIDNDRILSEITDFVETVGDKFPPLYTRKKEVGMVENILAGILRVAEEAEDMFQVFPIAEYLYQLKKNTAKYGLDTDGFPSIHIADSIMERDTYEYTKGIACDFHEELAVNRYCALSSCVRWSYLIADQCALDLNIEMKAGAHVPKDSDTTMTTMSDMSSDYDSSQFDKQSFIGSDISYVTNPNVRKMKLNQNESFDEGTASSIISRKSAAVGREKKVIQVREEFPALGASSSTSKMNATNPFSQAQFHPRDPRNPWAKQAQTETKSNVSFFTQDTDDAMSSTNNPWSRQHMLENSRLPDEASSFGLGRGSLVNGSSGTEFKTKGRGLLTSLNTSFTSETSRASSGRGRGKLF